MSSFQGTTLPYDQKLEKLQRYLPFLRKMITKLERTKDPSRAAQLQKMKHLLGILTDNSRKLKYELLVKCEGVLQKLHDKIEGQESDDDVMEVPQPSRPPPPQPQQSATQRRLLYPESEWERPSPPREMPHLASSSSVSRLPDNPHAPSPPLSSIVERISMSSPSTNFNDMDQPRSPSPEVVAQIPGAFAGTDHQAKKFERGREILRKLMVGMSKTLDETGVESPPDAEISAPRGPKIIPLERENSDGTPDPEVSVDDVEESLKGSDCSSRRPDTDCAVMAGPSDGADAYNPEDEWTEVRKKPAFRPAFMAKPPLSKEDLEELNRDLGTGAMTTGAENDTRKKMDSTSSKTRPKYGQCGRRGDDSIERDNAEREHHDGSSGKNRLEIRKGETLAEAKRRRFEEWKRAEIERRKKRKAELKQSSHSKGHHESSRSSSTHAHKKEYHREHSSHKPDRSACRDAGNIGSDVAKGKEKDGMCSVDLPEDERTGSSKDPRTRPTALRDPRKTTDPSSEKSAEQLKPDATLEKVSEQLKKYSVQDLMKTVHESLSPIGKKKGLTDDLEQNFRCLVIRNLPSNTLRQDIFRLFHGFGIVELVLEVHFSFTCAGIAYAQLAEHAEAKRARKELADKLVHGMPVKIAPCADSIFKEAKRTYEQPMNEREEQYARRQNAHSQATPQFPGTSFPHQSHAPVNYHAQYPGPSHVARPVRSPAPAANIGYVPRSSKPGLLGFSPHQPVGPHHVQGPRFQPQNSTPRSSTPPRPSLTKHNFNNPYNAQPGQADRHMPCKNDPRLAAQISYQERKKQKLEKELEILRRHKEEREKRQQNDKRPQITKSVTQEKSVGLMEHRAASLGKFKIPKLKKPETTKDEQETMVTAPEPILSGSEDKSVATCHQEDTVSSTVDTDDLLVKRQQKRKRSRRAVISDSESESETSKAETEATKSSEAEECTYARNKSYDSQHVDQLPQRQSCSKPIESIAESKGTPESEYEREKYGSVESDSDKPNFEDRQAADIKGPLRKKPVVIVKRGSASVKRSDCVEELKEQYKPCSDSLQQSNLALDGLDRNSDVSKATLSAVPSETQTDDVTRSSALREAQQQPMQEVEAHTKPQHAEESTVSVDDRTERESEAVAATSKKVDKEPQIEPGECEYCSFNGKKIIYHYVVSHPGKPISVKLDDQALERVLKEELGPGDDSAKKPLSKDLEAKLLNDDLSWIPPSLMFDKTIACLYCKFTALNKRHMLQHIADHLQTGTSAPEKYSMKCRFCKVKSVNSHELLDHISSHTGEYRYSCSYCGYRVFRMYYLKGHMNNMHKGNSSDEILIEDADTSNGWVFGYVCKLCGYVQLHERNVKQHMDDAHQSSAAYTKINMCTRGPAIDISKKVSDALKRKKADDEKRAAIKPPPIADMTVFAVEERWLRDQSIQEKKRKADMDTLVQRFSEKLFVKGSATSNDFLKKLDCLEETPLQYLEAMRQLALQKAPELGEPSEHQGVQDREQDEEEDVNKNAAESDDAVSESSGDESTEEGGADDTLPLGDVLRELKSVRPANPDGFGYQITLKLASALQPPVPNREQEQERSEPGAAGVAIKVEPSDQFGFSAESDARAAEGLNSMTDDLDSLMNDFDRFEQEQEPRPKLRIRRLSGDMFSSDDPGASGLGGLMISSVISLTDGRQPEQAQADSAAKKAEDLFAFPPEGERRPWKYFLTLKDQSKVMRLMFHMHHKSAYKCNAVHCSLTTNNGTLFKLHLRNHEKCDVCAPGQAAYTCMNTRLVCVYCGYQGADLAEHVYKRHAVSQFQCGYCFYRTRQNAYMHEHQRRWHADMPTYFLQSDPANPPPGLNASHLVETEMVGESSLTPYICAQDGCDRTFIKAAVLEQHYKDAHPDVTAFPCHICGVCTTTFSSLIGHYVGHGYVAYHCAYCRYAHQDQNNVKKHLIDFHPDDSPKCYARIPKSMGVELSSAAAPVAPPRALVALAAPVKREPGSGPCSPEASATRLAVKQEQDQERAPAEAQVELEEAGETSQSAPPAPSAEPPAEPPPLLADDLYRCGNRQCTVRCDTLAAFKDHLLSCSQAVDGTLLCYHCPKQVKHVSTALEHIRLHGPRRYSCSLCDFSAPVPSYVTKHLKQKHRMSSCTTLPLLAERADPERDLFVVYPRQCVPRTEQPPAASGSADCGYGIDDIDQLPHRSVLFRPIHCKLCPYSSKVTRNLLKHLLCHRRGGDGAPVPVTAPSNPRPCDQRGEKMFDQMANLASGSGEVGVPRKQVELSAADLERLPKEVTEDKRYICSIPNCVYLTLNDTMLKYHIQALHSQMITYPCPHCKDLYMIPDKLSAHLRLHGPRLYKCKYCIYNHYQRSLVTRHVRDKHPMMPLVDVVVREPDDDEAARPMFKPWRCGLCKCQALSQQEMVEHAATVHDLRSQFKCGLCSVRSSVRSAFELHFAAKHPDEPVTVFAIYYKLDEADVETAVKVEHCQPIWQRNNPRRIRHVRGILIEEVKVPRGSPTKRKLSAGERTPAKKKPASLAAAVAAEQRASRAGTKAAAGQARRRAIKRALRQPRRLRPAAAAAANVQSEAEADSGGEWQERRPATDLKPPTAAKTEPAPATEEEFLSLFETKSCELGPMGDADVNAKMFVCPKCNRYKAKRRRDFSAHLCKELGYNRFVCGNCGHMNTTMANMRRHHDMMHKVARLPEAIVPLTPESAQEQWIEAVLNHQERQIEGRPATADKPAKSEPQSELEPKQLSTPDHRPEHELDHRAQPEVTLKSEPKTESEAPPHEPEKEPGLVPKPEPVPAAADGTLGPPSPPVYKCGYCAEQGSIPTLRVHWKAQHVQSRFKVIKQAQRFVCGHCVFQSAKIGGIRWHLTQKHPDKPVTDFATCAYDRQTRFKCGWCGERFTTRQKAEAHHQVLHAHLELKLNAYTARRAPRADAVAVAAADADADASVAESTVQLATEKKEPPAVGPAAAGAGSEQAAVAPAVYRCPLCQYRSPRLTYLDAHLLAHCKRYKCELCDHADGSRMLMVRHHAKKHPGEPERITLLEHVDQQLQKMKRVVRGKSVLQPDSPTGSDFSGGKRPGDPLGRAHKRPTGGGVARKSTARARAARSRVGRGVAIKSTGGVRRSPAPFSAYGSRPPAIESYSEVTTQLTLGGATSMRVNVPTLAQIVRLYPRCLVDDLRNKKLQL